MFSSGISAHFSYDTHYFLPNPSSDQALMINATRFSRALGSDTDFSVLEWSYDRDFRMRERDVQAFDRYGRVSVDDVPWSMMATTSACSAISWVRVATRTSLTAQAEYRYHLTGRHGLVACLGAISIADSLGQYDSAHRPPNGGVGYRFKFKPRVNVRFAALGPGYCRRLLPAQRAVLRTPPLTARPGGRPYPIASNASLQSLLAIASASIPSE
ncbi:hypothetical protein OL229_18080 [Neisseriaceae bacterium JH1-16]|nr:hypothetical protein [Neisseriaceae bacterium JH1-16]